MPLLFSVPLSLAQTQTQDPVLCAFEPPRVPHQQMEVVALNNNEADRARNKRARTDTGVAPSTAQLQQRGILAVTASSGGIAARHRQPLQQQPQATRPPLVAVVAPSGRAPIDQLRRGNASLGQLLVNGAAEASTADNRSGTQNQSQNGDWVSARGANNDQQPGAKGKSKKQSTSHR
jgi:hypothetical protein